MGIFRGRQNNKKSPQVHTVSSSLPVSLRSKRSKSKRKRFEQMDLCRGRVSRDNQAKSSEPMTNNKSIEFRTSTCAIKKISTYDGWCTCEITCVRMQWKNLYENIFIYLLEYRFGFHSVFIHTRWKKYRVFIQKGRISSRLPIKVCETSAMTRWKINNKIWKIYEIKK